MCFFPSGFRFIVEIFWDLNPQHTIIDLNNRMKTIRFRSTKNARGIFKNVIHAKRKPVTIHFIAELVRNRIENVFIKGKQKHRIMTLQVTQTANKYNLICVLNWIYLTLIYEWWWIGTIPNQNSSKQTLIDLISEAARIFFSWRFWTWEFRHTSCPMFCL